MLSQLYIKNLAVIKEASIDLTEGLNVFTGETGAGKSVIIGAIGAVLGRRMYKDQIRTGEQKACVSVLFTDLNRRARDLLDELGFSADEDGALLITREFTADGRNSCRINTRPATISVLKQIGCLLMDIHGQWDNNQLLQQEYQMELIDRYGNLTQTVDQYRLEYRQLTAIQKEMRSLQMDEGEKARRLDLLRYQINEIEEAELTEGEEEELIQQRRKIQNAERILSGLAEAHDSLSGDDDGEYSGAITMLENAASSLSNAARYLPEFVGFAEKVQEMVYELQEVSSEISDQLCQMDYDLSELDEIEARLDEIYRLKRKYGDSYEKIMLFYQDAKQQLDAITFAQERIDKLNAAYQVQLQQVTELAEAISQRRSKAGEEFITHVQSELAFLNMPNIRFVLQNDIHLPKDDGIDSISLLISANPGELPKPLSRIASGGELSRIMLAIKNIMWSQDDTSTMIFDEVDTGVSGRAAQKIGRKLAQVAQHRQVICVTHLAQIAVCAQNHLLIQKDTVDGHTYTNVFPLKGENRLQELARIINGDHITDTTVRTAREMLEQFAAQQKDISIAVAS